MSELNNAIYSRDHDTIKKLLIQGHNINKKASTLLCGYITPIRYLLSETYHWDKRCYVLKLFIKYGNLDVKNEKYLCEIFMHCEYDFARTLIKHGANVNFAMEGIEIIYDMVNYYLGKLWFIDQDLLMKVDPTFHIKHLEDIMKMIGTLVEYGCRLVIKNKNIKEYLTEIHKKKYIKHINRRRKKLLLIQIIYYINLNKNKIKNIQILPKDLIKFIK